MAYTIAEKIEIAKISEYIVGNDIQKRQLYGGGTDLQLPNKIYNIRKSVEYIYGIDPSNDTLEQTSNYMLALCVPYNLEAAYIMNNGSWLGNPRLDRDWEKAFCKIQNEFNGLDRDWETIARQIIFMFEIFRMQFGY